MTNMKPRFQLEKDKLNDLAREHYMAECAKLIDQLNQLIPEGQPKL